MITTEESLNFINHIRRWNNSHPIKPLYIACTNLEYGFESTLSNIIIPYFNELDTNSYSELNSIAQDGLTLNLFEILDSLLILARKEQFTGQYPFITSSYIENVVENLISTHKSLNINYDYYCPKALIKNLTDTMFFGKYIINNKVLFYGGNYDTRTRFIYPDNGNFLSAGSYLNYDFEITKGKTYSLSVQSLSYSLDEMKNRTLDSCAFIGWEYRKLIKRMQNAYNENLLNPENYYIINAKLNRFERFIAKKAINNSNNPVLLEKIDWKKILDNSKLSSKKLYKEVLSIKEGYMDFDKIIIVPQSPVIIARKKR